jgi:hypothetical protein
MFAELLQTFDVARGKLWLKTRRRDFLDACYSYANSLRIRKQPKVRNWGERVFEDCWQLKILRDHIVDWVLLESELNPSDEFNEALLSLLERLLELKSPPPELLAWADEWFDAHRIFVYETFLYIVAALVKTGSFDTLHLVFTNHYLLPETTASGKKRFFKFTAFYGHSETLKNNPIGEGQKLITSAGGLIKLLADRTDLPFADIMQAELLVSLMACITEGMWYPQTLKYLSPDSEFPFFVRAARHRDFQKLARITGIDSGDKLRAAVESSRSQELRAAWRTDFPTDLWEIMNMDALDTLF